MPVSCKTMPVTRLSGVGRIVLLELCKSWGSIEAKQSPDPGQVRGVSLGFRPSLNEDGSWTEGPDSIYDPDISRGSANSPGWSPG